MQYNNTTQQPHHPPHTHFLTHIQNTTLISIRKQPAAIKALWEAEEALTVAQRRERYKCGKWESYKPHIDPKFKVNTPVSSNATHLQWFNKKFDVTKSSPYAQWKEDDVINSKIATWQGNITTLEFDAVLNAANRSLLGGGGIDGAIHSAAGNELYKECAMLDGCETGKSKITRGYNLPAKYVVATVGPIGENPEALYNAYRNSLELAKKHKIRTFALCGVSTGIYGYPLLAATHIALATVRQWMEKNKSYVDMILFCTFLEREVTCYDNLMPLYFPKSSVLPKRPIPAREEVEEENEAQEVQQEAAETTTSTTTTTTTTATEQVVDGDLGHKTEANTAEANTEPSKADSNVGEVKEAIEAKAEEVQPSKPEKVEGEESKAVDELATSLANTKIQQ